MLQETVARNVCSLLASELIASINVRRLSRRALFAPWAAPARPPLQTTRLLAAQLLWGLMAFRKVRNVISVPECIGKHITRN